MIFFNAALTPERGAVYVDGKPVLLVSFSGGQTSAYMAATLKAKIGNLFHLVFMFANTGCENEDTLVFVDRCDKAFDLNVVWLEAVINPVHGKGVTHRITDFNRAYRVHQYADPLHPFHAHIRKSGIPNANKPQCSDRLKAFAIEDYKRHMGYQGQPHAIGIRADEINRVMNATLVKLIRACGMDPNTWRLLPTHDQRMQFLLSQPMLSAKQRKPADTYSRKLRQYGLVYPLADWLPTDKSDINDFWEDQPFRLGLEEHEGNCQTCWKKSDRKLLLLAKEHPERFEAFAYWEAHYQHVKPNTDGKPRVFFRKHRASTDLLAESKEHDAAHLRRLIGAGRDDVGDGCSESCESYSLF